MKRYASDEQGKRGKWKPSTEPLLHGRPCLNQLLTDMQWDDGKPRTPCALKFKFGLDQCSMTLVDDENEMYISTTAPTADAALELLEAALAKGAVSWRSYSGFKGKKK